jgi:hypothetical protein
MNYLAITECHPRSTPNSQVVGHVTHKHYVMCYTERPENGLLIFVNFQIIWHFFPTIFGVIESLLIQLTFTRRFQG